MLCNVPASRTAFTRRTSNCSRTHLVPKTHRVLSLVPNWWWRKDKFAVSYNRNTQGVAEAVTQPFTRWEISICSQLGSAVVPSENHSAINFVGLVLSEKAIKELKVVWIVFGCASTEMGTVEKWTSLGDLFTAMRYANSLNGETLRMGTATVTDDATGFRVLFQMWNLYLRDALMKTIKYLVHLANY